MNTPQKKSDHATQLARSVLERISNERVCPKSRFWCWIEELMVWGLWVLSVLIGAISVAVICYSLVHGMYGFYEATHTSQWALVLDVMPYVWMLVFLAMAGIGYRNMRHTKRGYTYPFWKILISSVVVSIGLGLVLHVAGLGKTVDTLVADYMPLYISQEAGELVLWQAPEEGRLVGVYSVKDTATEPCFTDVEGFEWKINMSELTMMDMNELENGDKVRVLGIQTGTSTIHACGVFPWMFDTDMAMNDMDAQHQQFVSRMYAHKDRAVERIQLLTEEARGIDNDSLCHTLPVIDRISESMQ